MRNISLLAGALLASTYGCAWADGDSFADDIAQHVQGIAIGTFQSTSQDRVDGQKVHNEGNGQLYLLGNLPVGPGQFNLEVRAGTTPRNGGVTNYYGEVNDSVGETLNRDGKGRIAATQFYYTWNTPIGGTLDIGMIDPTGMLDANEIADDEYSQFMGTSFVNNPSIDYPSPALGLHYQAGADKPIGYQLFVSSSSGIQDPDDPTYGNVFDVGESGKGVFSAAELTWKAATMYGDVGVWYNSSDHTQLNNPARTDADNVGAYTTIGGKIGRGQWVGWAGIADKSVSEAANFLALAYSRPLVNMTLGAGIARIGASDDMAGRTASIEQAELYLRIPVAQHLYLTPDIQYVNNSGFDPDNDDVIVTGVRAGYEF